jgi:hypothetical protein
MNGIETSVPSPRAQERLPGEATGGPSDAVHRCAGREDGHAVIPPVFGRRAPARATEMTGSFDDEAAMPRGCDGLGLAPVTPSAGDVGATRG